MELSDEELLRRADRAWDDDDFEGCKDFARRALGSLDGVVRSRAAYFLGLVAYHGGETEQAEANFARAISENPRAQDAAFYLGELSERRGDDESARRWYGHVLSINRWHTRATERLRHLGGPVSGALSGFAPGADRTPAAASASAGSPGDSPPDAPVAVNAAVGEFGTGPFGAYETLQGVNDPLSAAPLLLLDRVVTERVTPRLSAHLGDLLTNAFWAALVSYVAVKAYAIFRWRSDYARNPSPQLPTLVGLILLATAVVIAWGVLLVLTTSYTIARGRVQVSSGIVVRKDRNLELYRVTNIVVSRNLLQRLTNDGTLSFSAFEAGRPVDQIELVGLMPLPELRRFHQRLLNLVFALRSSNAVRGIIQ